MALSTIKPTTSTCLSTIRIDLLRSGAATWPAERLIEQTRDDLRWTVDEAARIEREFGEAVNLTISRDPAFKMALDALDI